MPRKDHNQASFSVIASGAVLDGSIKTSGDLLVHGEVRGSIEARLLNVGEDGRVDGDVSCRDVLVSGRVRANIRVDSAKISGSGRVTGDVHHLSLEVDPGGFLHGRVLRRDVDGDVGANGANDAHETDENLVTVSQDAKLRIASG